MDNDIIDISMDFDTFGNKVGAIYRRELDKLGFTTEWVNLPDSLRRAGHLVATRKGSQGKRLFLIGHLDTVFELDMAFSPYTKLNDSTATGQGVNFGCGLSLNNFYLSMKLMMRFYCTRRICKTCLSLF